MDMNVFSLSGLKGLKSTKGQGPLSLLEDLFPYFLQTYCYVFHPLEVREPFLIITVVYLLTKNTLSTFVIAE